MSCVGAQTGGGEEGLVSVQRGSPTGPAPTPHRPGPHRPGPHRPGPRRCSSRAGCCNPRYGRPDGTQDLFVFLLAVREREAKK